MKKLVPILAVVFLVGLTVAFAQRPPKASKSATPALKPVDLGELPGAEPARSSPPGKPRAASRQPKRDPDKAAAAHLDFLAKMRGAQRVHNPDEEGVERIREAIDLRSAPADDVARRIADLLEGERPSRAEEVVVVPEPIGNRLLVSATPSMFREVVELIEKIDVQPKCVAIEALIAVVAREDKTAGKSPLADFKEIAPSQEEVAALIEKLKKSPGVEILARPTVMTLDNQAAFIHVGQRVPAISTVVTESGQTTTVDYHNVGLVLGVTARVSADNLVTMEIDLEKSNVASQTSDDADALAPRMDVVTTQATVAVESGQAVTLGGLKAESSSATEELIIILIPRVFDHFTK